MRSFRIFFALFTVLSASAFVVLQAVNWKVSDKEYEVSAECCGPQGARFTGLTAHISFDESAPEKSSISASIDANSISTGSKTTDMEVKELIGAKANPNITFVSYKIVRNGKPYAYKVSGKLTLNGIKKDITFPFTFDSKNDQVKQFPFQFKETFYGTMKIPLKDFKINKGGDTMKVRLKIPVKRGA